MATRRATRKYPDLASFFADREEHLSSGFCFLPPGAVRGELAPELKLDLSVPIVGRIGPVTAQVVQRAPDGGYGLKLPDFEMEAGRALKKLDKSMAAARAYFESTGDIGSAPSDAATDPQLLEELERLRSRVAELEQALADAQAQGASSSPAEEAADEVSAQAVDTEAVASPPETAPQADAPDTEGNDAPDAPASTESSAPSPEVPAEEAAAAPAAEPEPARPRGIPIVDVSRVEPTMEGVTEGNGLLTGLLDIASNGLTGMLTLHEESGLVRYAYFSAGGPVAWRAVPLQEKEVLGMLLFKAGQVTKEQLQQSLDLMQTKGIRQGEAFIEMGVMSFSQLIMVLGRQSEYLVQQVMRSAKGAWTFHELKKLPEAFLPPPVRVGSLLFRSMIQEAKSLRGRQLADSLKGQVNSYIQLHPTRRKLLADLGLNAAERKLVGIIAERTLRMRELFSMSPLSRQNTAAVFYALIKVGMFTFGERETRDRYLQRVGAGIAKKKRQLIQCSHFDVLECHWISLPSEIEENYKKLKEEYNLSNYDDLPEDLAAVVTRISNRVDEAYAILKDDFQRREYRKTLVEDFMIVQSAELLAKKGEMAIMRKDTRLATNCFAKAMELQPRSPEYRASYQRARAGG